MRRRRIIVSVWAGVVALLSLGSAAGARLSLGVEVGWSGMYRAGHWTPVFITASDDQARPARNATLEILLPHDDLARMRIYQSVTLGPEPTTFVLFMPLPATLGETVAVLRDAEMGRKLIERSFAPGANPGPGVGGGWYSGAGRDDVFIGTSGRRAALGRLEGPFQWDEAKEPEASPGAGQVSPVIRLGHLSVRQLPAIARGYDGLSLLVLNSPDLPNMPLETQQAIAEWVRGGGRLLMWMGEGLVPPDSPIARLLPCTFDSETQAIPLSLGEAKAFGLVARVERFTGLKLEGRPGAGKVSMLGGKAALWHWRQGLGDVGVISFDASQLVFDGSSQAKVFWRPLLRELLRPDPPPEDSEPPYYGRYGDRDGIQRSLAMDVVVNRLGNVPGVGRFDFSYIAIVLIAMMLIVGPVDWLVLKKLGRQPWTWATTAGCIVLVTVGGLYLGHAFRSGELYYRSLRVVDQLEGEVISAVDVTGIYSPRTQDYRLGCARESWWQPANIDLPYYGGGQHVPGDIDMVQDSRGTRPLPMVVNVWNLRFMQGEQVEAKGKGPVLRASLRRQRGQDGRDRLVGTISNLSEATLKGVYIRTGQGTAVLRRAPAEESDLPEPGGRPELAGLAAAAAGIAPGQTVRVDAPIEPNDRGFGKSEIDLTRRWQFGSSNPYLSSDRAFLRASCDLNPHRSRQIESLLRQRDDLACVYAEGVLPSAPVKLENRSGQEALEKHWQVLRAVVELEK